MVLTVTMMEKVARSDRLEVIFVNLTPAAFIVVLMVMVTSLLAQ